MRGGSATFELTLPSAQDSCFYRVLTDADEEESETDESNNLADSSSFGSPSLVADFAVDPVAQDPAIYFEKASVSGDQVFVFVRERRFAWGAG